MNEAEKEVLVLVLAAYLLPTFIREGTGSKIPSERAIQEARAFVSIAEKQLPKGIREIGRG